MRLFLAFALAAGLFVAAGCSCATGSCAPAAPACNPCAAPAPAPAPVCSPCGF